MRRAAAISFLATLALLPWAALPPFPWLHEHAQWSDATFALAVAFWLAACLRERAVPHTGPATVPIVLYVAASAASYAFAEVQSPAGQAKVLGIAMLSLLAMTTTDLLPRIGAQPVAIVVAATSLVTALAAVLGHALFHAGIPTPLVGTYGDLQPGPYARVQAGFPHPNLLASYCIFAYGVIARADAGLSMAWRRAVTASLILTSALTFSRAFLALLLAVAVRHADTPRRRRWTTVLAGVLVTSFATLGALNLALDPTRPWDVTIRAEPSPRRDAFVSSAHTLASRPLVGVGPDKSPGFHDGHPMDAHITPLNVAATLGLPALVFFLAIPLTLWRRRLPPTDLATWAILAGLALDGLAQDVEDFRHLWLAFGFAGPEAVRPVAHNQGQKRQLTDSCAQPTSAKARGGGSA